MWQLNSYRNADCITSTQELLEFCLLDSHAAPYEIDHNPRYPLRVHRYFASIIKKNNWYDPLLLQVIPQKKELIQAKNFSEDPLAEIASIAAPGLIHKYFGRALLCLSKECALSCRFCFRRNFPFNTTLPHTQSQWQQTVDYLSHHTEIYELIFSGGDPLMLSVSTLQKFTDSLLPLKQLRCLRFHTKAPIVWPECLDDTLIKYFKELNANKQVILVLHINHPQEITPLLLQKLLILKSFGIVVLNQSVLLSGINNSEEILTELFQTLVQAGILPYYLHQLDKVHGTSHFEVDPLVAKTILHTITERVPGYAIPRYVQQLPNEKAKKYLF